MRINTSRPVHAALSKNFPAGSLLQTVGGETIYIKTSKGGLVKLRDGANCTPLEGEQFIDVTDKYELVERES